MQLGVACIEYVATLLGGSKDGATVEVSVRLACLAEQLRAGGPQPGRTNRPGSSLLSATANRVEMECQFSQTKTMIL